MSHRLISRSADLKQLRDEGYHLEIRGGHLLVRIPGQAEHHSGLKPNSIPG